MRMGGYGYKVESYELRTKLDYSKTNDYIYQQMELFANDYSAAQRESAIRKHELEIHNAWLNPIESLSEQRDYLSVAASHDVEFDMHYSHRFMIDNSVQVEKRYRYNFWEALADLGGLQDGLSMLVNFLMAPLAATMFENRLLKDNLFTQSLSSV